MKPTAAAIDAAAQQPSPGLRQPLALRRTLVLVLQQPLALRRTLVLVLQQPLADAGAGAATAAGGRWCWCCSSRWI